MKLSYFIRHCWKMYDDSNTLICHIDAEDQSKANWLRYIRSSKNPNLQNMEAFLHEGQVYYTTIKDIMPNDELLLNTEKVMYIYTTTSPSTHALLSSEPEATDNKCVILSSTVPSVFMRKLVECSDQIEGIEAVSSCLDEASQSQSDYPREMSPDSPPATCCIQSADTSAVCETVAQEITISQSNRPTDVSHKPSASRPRPFACDQCNRTYDQRSNLNRHQRNTHDKDETLPFICIVCSKAFRTTRALGLHNRIHPEQCAALFSNENDGQNSYFACSVRKYTCDICQNMFTTKSSLVRHQRVHTGVKPFKCGLCQKEFAMKINLKAHLRNIHSVDIANITSS
jgi:hypothetical protein